MPKEPRRPRKPQNRAPQATEHKSPSPSASEKEQPPRVSLVAVCLWALFVVVLLYVAIGFAPILPVEGDETAIANGAAQLAHVPTLNKSELYRYHFQPLPYTLLSWGDRWLGVEPLTTFGVLTWLGFVSFLGFGSRFCSRLSNVSFPTAGLILLLFQETFTAAYYANTSMIAAAFLAPAALLLKRGTWPTSAAAGILLALAIMSRFDALLVAPALGLIVVGKRRERLLNSMVFAGVAIVSVLLLIWLFGVSLGSIYGEVTSHRTLCTNVRWAMDNTLSLFNPFVSALALLGLGVCLVWRSWRLFGQSVVGLAPFVAAYGRSVTTPKYLFFAIPFVALAVAVAFRWIGHLSHPRWRTIAILLISVFFLQQYSFRFAGPSLEQQLARPSGDVFWTADGFRMRTSYALAPWMWNSFKSSLTVNLATCDRELQRFLSTQPSGAIVANTGSYWLAMNSLVYELRQYGYLPVTLKPESPGPPGSSSQKPWQIQAFRNPQGQTCHVYWLDPMQPPAQTIQAFLVEQARIQPTPPQAGAARPYAFFSFSWGVERNIAEIPSHFETVTLDLRDVTPRK